MNEKEMKKLDQKGEEEVSGGVDDKSKAKKWGDKIKIKSALLAQGYGAVALTPILNHEILYKNPPTKLIKNTKPKDTLATPQPQTQPQTEDKK